jgi:hypothetical protein
MTKTITATMGMIGVALLCMAGCTVKNGGGTHTLDANDPVDIDPGNCFVVAGPFHIPGFAVTAYSVTSDFADNMEVGVVSAGYAGCDPINGFAYGAGIGSVASSEEVPVDSYFLEILCDNAAAVCVPTVDYWTYDD